MVFHAYIKWVSLEPMYTFPFNIFNLHTSKSNSESVWRYMITAPDADTVDEWWRAVSAPAKKDLGYKRLAPDFYTYSKGYPFDAAPEFTSRLIFTLLNDRDGRGQTLIPDQKRTDHRSGQSYYIRSKSNPRAYWWVNKDGGHIMASITARTRFRFCIDGKEDGTVMIAQDAIHIHGVTNSKLEVGISNNEVHLGAGSHKLLFGDLKNHYLGQEILDNNSKIFRVEGAGEEWELVR